jgi:hypothetical protein
MKFIISAIILFLIGLSTHTCSTSKRVANNQAKNENYIRYLSSVINDTVYYEFPELTIIDKRIYPILDSIILWSEKCKYFDTRVKYLNSFRFSALPRENELQYFIDAHESPYSALGLLLVRTGFLTDIEKKVAIFYYKHYMFVVPKGDYRGQKELEYFPFVKLTGNNLKIRAPKFLEEKSYASYINFGIKKGKFTIIENEVCGLEILIQ